MSSLINGKNTSSVKIITPEGFLLAINGKDYFLSFTDHPYFRHLPIDDIFDVKIDDAGDLRWEKYDIDLCEEVIKNPDMYPLVMQNPVKKSTETAKTKTSHRKNIKKHKAARLILNT